VHEEHRSARRTRSVFRRWNFPSWEIVSVGRRNLDLFELELPGLANVSTVFAPVGFGSGVADRQVLCPPGWIEQLAGIIPQSPGEAGGQDENEPV